MLEIIFIITLCISIWVFFKSPLNPIPLLCVLSVFFGMVPGYYYYYTSEVISYSWRTYEFLGPIVFNDARVTSGLYTLSIYALMLSLGALVASLVTKPKKLAYVYYQHKNIIFITAIVLLMWSVSAVYYLNNAGWNIYQWLLPVVDPDAKGGGSGYFKMIYMFCPVLLMCLYAWKYNKFEKFCWLWLSMAVLAAFSTHQRRELVTLVLFVFIMIYQFNWLDPKVKNRVPGNHIKSDRLFAVAIFSVGIALVPVLWWSRIYFTTLWDGAGAVNPLEIRGVLDVIFGSPATGYPALMLVQSYVVAVGTDFLYLPKFIASMPIPRWLWENKIVDLDTQMQRYYETFENPSSFWFGELYYMFGPFVSIIAAFLLGLFGYMLCEKIRMSPTVFGRTFFALIFMQSITLFKNGFAVFSLNITVLLFIIGAAWLYSTKRVRYS